jgi:hypothetical protein
MSSLRSERGGDRQRGPGEALCAILGQAERLRRLGRNRAAAASLLQAASMTRSADEREVFRRHGALLLMSRPNDHGRLAC